jgi:methyl-accepting chemotaxis protein
MEKLANSDVMVAVPVLASKDELGRMGRPHSNILRPRRSRKSKRRHKRNEDIKRWQQEDAESLAREKEAARQDQIAIDNLASGLAKIADGDLMYRIDTVFAPKTEKLRLDFQSGGRKAAASDKGNPRELQSDSKRYRGNFRCGR